MSQPPSGPGRKRTTRARKGRGSAATNPSRPEPRVLTTMRLRQSLRKDLEATAARNRRSVADVAQELLDEALRMRHCPGDFSRGQDSGRIRKAFPQLSRAQVTAALMYYTRYRDEVQARIDANAAMTPEAIERRYPGLVRFTR